jgi:hypothetical protein
MKGLNSSQFLCPFLNHDHKPFSWRYWNAEKGLMKRA